MCFIGVIIDGVAYQEVKSLNTCVNKEYFPFGTIEKNSVLSSAYCQSTKKRKIISTSGYIEVPYDCGCVKKNDNIYFPSEQFNCSNNKPFYTNCEFLMILNPSYKSCTMNIPIDNIIYGGNSTTYKQTGKFCALIENITSGIFNGCMCVKDDFMEPIYNKELKLKHANCKMYSLNYDTNNCDVLFKSLPGMFEACIATGVLCLLISIFYFMVLMRAVICPGCCTFSPKHTIPISDPKLNIKYMTYEPDEEAKMIENALKASGMIKDKTNKVQPINIHEINDIDEIQNNKMDRKDATTMYLAWYRFAAKK